MILKVPRKWETHTVYSDNCERKRKRMHVLELRTEKRPVNCFDVLRRKKKKGHGGFTKRLTDFGCTC